MCQNMVSFPLFFFFRIDTSGCFFFEQIRRFSKNSPKHEDRATAEDATQHLRQSRTWSLLSSSRPSMRLVSPFSLALEAGLADLDDLLCTPLDPLDGFLLPPVPSGVVVSTPPPTSPMSEQETKRERQRAKERDKARRAYQRKMVRLYKEDVRVTHDALCPPRLIAWGCLLFAVCETSGTAAAAAGRSQAARDAVEAPQSAARGRSEACDLSS